MKERNVTSRPTFSRMIAAALVAMAFALPIATPPARADQAPVVDGSAVALTARFANLKSELANNQFQRPLYLSSREGTDILSGDVYAVVNHPFPTASAALSQVAQWCDVLILHLNTKLCRPSSENGASQLQVSIGKKFDQPIDKAYRVDFAYKLVARTDTYLQVRLNADEGPLSTRDYRIVVEAAPAGPSQIYVRLSYSYGYGTMAQLAMKAYLGTIGRNKVGFTVVGQTPEGQPQPVSGMRGVVERNTMRYYLAIESYLGALSLPASARAEKSFRDWFAATEIFARQLHEMEQSEYMTMKRKEYQRQQQAQTPAVAEAPPG